MSDPITVARPYAKAIFQHALQLQQLAEWSVILQHLTHLMRNSAIIQFIDNPAATVEQHTQLIQAVLYTLQPTMWCNNKAAVDNLIKLLAMHKRLLILPEIYNKYNMLRAEHEKTLVVTVISFASLNIKQTQQLIDKLSHRLQRQVTLEVSLDKTLLGGAIIHAGDLVIDGSVRGKLTKLATNLAA